MQTAAKCKPLYDEARSLPLAVLIRRAFPYTQLQTALRVAELSGCAERRRVKVLLKCRLGRGHKPIDGLLPGHQLYQPLFHDGAQRGAGVVIKDAEVAILES